MKRRDKSKVESAQLQEPPYRDNKVRLASKDKPPDKAGKNVRTD